jgi:two-component system, cell cycle sensor histidine kinase and response regulator CckA
MNSLVKVLLVEDNPIDARVLRNSLAKVDGQSFGITHVDSLQKALLELASESYDVILLDLSLPDAHGLETFTSVQQTASGVAIVVLTGLSDETVGIRAIQMGAQDYLLKGQVNGSLLVRAIRYAIERARLHNSLQEAKAKIKILSGLLPICATCKNIRDDMGYWNKMEDYISTRTDADFTHSICPECVKVHYPEIYEELSGKLK